VRDGDAIILLPSTGVHTNGLTLCRALADRLPEGYLTKLPDGRTYGETLLDPSAIYVKFVAACQDAGIPLHYTAHVTGHGWRKLMRLDEPFVYRMTDVRPPLPIFNFIMKHGPVDIREAYATFNMGAGFAAYVAPEHAQQTIDIAQSLRHDAWRAGTVHKQGARKAVEIAPLNITFEADTLQVR
jgi:phosphoribosylformylglycinamidine cyclo-ligase